MFKEQDFIKCNYFFLEISNSCIANFSWLSGSILDSKFSKVFSKELLIGSFLISMLFRMSAWIIFIFDIALNPNRALIWSNRRGIAYWTSSPKPFWTLIVIWPSIFFFLLNFILCGIVIFAYWPAICTQLKNITCLNLSYQYL